MKKSNVRLLQLVRKGEKIGEVGDTGNAMGNAHHLRFSVTTISPHFWKIDESIEGWKKSRRESSYGKPSEGWKKSRRESSYGKPSEGWKKSRRESSYGKPSNNPSNSRRIKAIELAKTATASCHSRCGYDALVPCIDFVSRYKVETLESFDHKLDRATRRIGKRERART
jgi:hypothetical protein